MSDGEIAVYYLDWSRGPRRFAFEQTRPQWLIKYVMTNAAARFFPSVVELLQLDPSELAGHLLNYFMTLNSGFKINPVPTIYSLGDQLTPSQSLQVRQALLEAFGWLEANGLVSYDPSVQPADTPWRAVTRAGRAVQKDQSLDSFKRQQLLRKELLHPAIYAGVSNDFIRADYDATLLKAFAEIEYRVRDATNFGASVIGTDLMRRAFDATSGPLRDQAAPVPEREALAHLFAGAIGLGKNPHSHRRIGRTDAVEALQLLAFASYLLNIVDERSTVPVGTGSATP